MLSNRILKIQPSATLKISGKAKEMRRNGIPVIDFSVGEPDFDTPESVKAAGVRAIQENQTKYTQTDGIPELKTAIIQRMKNDDGLEYRPEQIIVSPGAKASIFLVLSAITNPGDEIIIPAPYWVSYPEQVKLTGGIPVIVPTSAQDGFMLDPDGFRKKITNKTRAVILNNPSNPTGALYETERLKTISMIALENNLLIIADEIYSKLVFDGKTHIRCAGFGMDFFENTITIDGASKAYSMTGWRIGYAAGNDKIISGMKSMQGHLTSNPCSIAQWAAVAAFSGDQEIVAHRAMEFEKRRNFVYSRFREIPGIEVVRPQGAFYLFPNVAAYLGSSFQSRMIEDTIALSEYLLTTAHVATVPGVAFGAPEHIRISYATSMQNLEQGIQRIRKALEALRPH